MEPVTNSSAPTEQSGWRDFVHSAYFALFIASVLILAEDFWFMNNLDQWSYSLVTGSTTPDHCHWILENQNIEYYQPECVGEFLQPAGTEGEADHSAHAEKAVVVLLPDILYETYLQRDLHYTAESEEQTPRFVQILEWLAQANPQLIASDFDLSRHSATAHRLTQSPSFNNQPWLLIHPMPVVSPTLRNNNLTWMKDLCGNSQRNLDFIFPTILADGRYVTHYYSGRYGFAGAIQANVWQFLEDNRRDIESDSRLCAVITEGQESAIYRRLERGMTKENMWYGLLEEDESEKAQKQGSETGRIDFRQTANLLQIDLNCDDSEDNGCQHLLSKNLAREVLAQNDDAMQAPLQMLNRSLSNHILIVGGSYGTGDRYDTPIGPLDGVTIHALAALTALNTTEKETLQKAFSLVFDIVLGIVTAYVFAAIWSFHAQARAEGSYVKSLGYYIVDVLTLLFFLAMAASLSDFLLQRNMWLNPIAVILGVYYDSLTGRSDTVEGLVCTPRQEAGSGLPQDKAGFDLSVFLLVREVYSSIIDKNQVYLSKWWTLNGVVMLLTSGLKLAVVIGALSKLIIS